MAYANLSVTAPTGTTYDSANPTQGTEELNMTLHAILQDMEDAAPWFLTDGSPTASDLSYYFQWLHDVIEDVFDYAEGAIETYRSEGTPTLAKPEKATVKNFAPIVYPQYSAQAFKVWCECQKICYLIYYMWKTETDPLRVKDYIRDMLLAWPLQDVTIDLADDGGSQMKIYPQWNAIDT